MNYMNLRLPMKLLRPTRLFLASVGIALFLTATSRWPVSSAMGS